MQPMSYAGPTCITSRTTLKSSHLGKGLVMGKHPVDRARGRLAAVRESLLHLCLNSRVFIGDILRLLPPCPVPNHGHVADRVHAIIEQILTQVCPLVMIILAPLQLFTCARHWSCVRTVQVCSDAIALLQLQKRQKHARQLKYLVKHL